MSYQFLYTEIATRHIIDWHLILWKRIIAHYAHVNSFNLTSTSMQGTIFLNWRGGVIVHTNIVQSTEK